MRICVLLLFAVSPLFTNSTGAQTQIASPPTRKILVFSYEQDHFPGYRLMLESIQSTIKNNSDYRIQLYKEGQDSSRIRNDKYEAELVSFLHQKYDGENIDLIFIIGLPALDFLNHHEKELFPRVPRVFVVGDPEELTKIDPGPYTTGISGKMELGQNVELMLAENPGTKRIVVVLGRSKLDRYYFDEAHKQLAPYTNRVEFIYPDNFTIEELRDQLSSLPRDNLVFYVGLDTDSSGRGFTHPEGLSIVAPTSSVPVYTEIDTAIGTGALGGMMLSYKSLGDAAAQMGLRILAGEDPQNIPRQIVPAVPIFDWREMQRFGIDERSLPPGSIVEFRTPTAWEQYRGYIIAGLALIILQTMLIVSMVVARSRRRKAEDERNEFQAIAAAEHQRLDEVVANVPGIVWETHLDADPEIRHIDFISDYVEKLLGYTPDEVTSIPNFIFTRVFEQDKPDLERVAEETLAGLGQREVQFRCTHKDGSMVWVEGNLVARYDESGKVTGIRGVAIDVTSRKLAEGDLNSRELELRQAQRLGQIGSWEWDSGNDKVKWTNELYRIAGLDPRQRAPSFEEHRELYTPESFDRLRSAVSDAKENGTPYELELEMLRADGERIWVNAIGEVYERDDTDAVGLRGTLQDISGRKKAEHAIRESESRFRNMADSAPVLIWMSDVSPLISFVNRFGIDYTGLSEEQMEGTAWLDAIHQDDRQRCVDIYTAAYEDRQPFVYEYRIRRTDGEYQWFYCTSAPRFAVDGEFLGYVGTCVDINDRKKAEQSLQLALAQISELKNELHAENIYLKEVINLEHNFEEIIGHSDALKYVLYKVEQVAPTDATVLITGETGTGKELVARAIHNTSPRSNRPLVKVNCAALSASLIESELFGHERGSFTGASAQKIGRFELADRATIFLDEIGELPLELQSKLLRVIQEGEFERLGSSKTIKVNVRIIAATNRKLEDEVKKGAFREDLLFRLDVFPITVPPLRDRKEDIPLLVEHFATRFAKKVGKNILSVSPSTIRRLSEHTWPGNVRELANVIERSVIHTQTDNLQVIDTFSAFHSEPGPLVSDNSLEMIERKHITEILKSTNWKIEGAKGAAVILGLNPSTLRTRMLKLGISKRHGDSLN